MQGITICYYSKSYQQSFHVVYMQSVAKPTYQVTERALTDSQ